MRAMVIEAPGADEGMPGLEDVPQRSGYFRDQPAFVDIFSGRCCRTAAVSQTIVHKPTGSWTNRQRKAIVYVAHSWLCSRLH